MRIEVTPATSLADEPLRIVVGEAPPGKRVTVRGELRDDAAQRWASWGAFDADASGQVDLAKQAPVEGTWDIADPLGLIWSMRDEGRPPGRVSFFKRDVKPLGIEIVAETPGQRAASALIERRVVAPDIERIEVRDHGLVGTYFRPSGAGPFPGVIVVGGSGGGLNEPPAALMASRGLAALALAYFGVEPLPLDLIRIPLEYFETAIGWLEARPEVRSGGVGFVGTSRGGELALLLGSVYPGIRTVVAYVPSNVVWRGCCDATTSVAWTVGGRAIAAMPPPGLRQPLAVDRAEIPVERIHGAILLISGHDDGVWPSAEMAEKIVARLKRNGFPFAFESLTYDVAGHGISRPYASTMNLNSRRHPLTGRMVHLGGTPAGTAKANEDSWRRMLLFVDQHLRNAGPASEASPSATNGRSVDRSAMLP